MGESYKYYFVMVICSFVRGNVMYILSKLISKKGMQIADFPKEILRSKSSCVSYEFLSVLVRGIKTCGGERNCDQCVILHTEYTKDGKKTVIN